MKYINTFFLILSTYTLAQVTISKSFKPANATLDINSNGSLFVNGIKPPIVSKQDLIDKRIINGNTYTYIYNQDHTGTFVYVDDITITTDEIKETSNIVDKGVYYFDGANWYGISSELKDYSLFTVGDPQSLIPVDRDEDFANNVTTKVSLSFNENDKIADNVATLGSSIAKRRIVTYSCDKTKYDDSSYYTNWCDKLEDTKFYFFTIKEDGFYEITSYLGYNPNRDLSGFNSISYIFSKTVMCNDTVEESKCMFKYWNDQDIAITEIATTATPLMAKQTSSVSTITTPKTVVELKAGDRIYFYLIIPEFVMDNKSNNGFKGFNGNVPFNNITKYSNNIDYLQFSKFVSIRKL